MRSPNAMITARYSQIFFRSIRSSKVSDKVIVPFFAMLSNRIFRCLGSKSHLTLPQRSQIWKILYNSYNCGNILNRKQMKSIFCFTEFEFSLIHMEVLIISNYYQYIIYFWFWKPVRDNLKKKRILQTIKNKTASFFACCCL